MEPNRNEQLTKEQLKNLKEFSIIIEKLFDQENTWMVDKIIVQNSKESVYSLVEVFTPNKRTKLTVSNNFNKEGDRRYNSPHGSVIVKYYSNGNS